MVQPPIIWNWQQPDWPRFKFDPEVLREQEQGFLISSGVLTGLMHHLHQNDRESVILATLGSEALTTSEIEGEYLNRESVQSSIRRRFGLSTDKKKASPVEEGISDLMVDVYRNFDTPLTHEILWNWHKMVCKGSQELDVVGGYRTHKEPMQVISGAVHKRKIHFEAPPSERLPREMERFLLWYQRTAPTGKQPLLPLMRAAISHLYFESIHPFEDGNGRIGRALVVKSLGEGLGNPMLLDLSETLLKGRKKYYDYLEKNNKSLQINQWLEYFADVILAAQKKTQAGAEFVIAKTKFFDQYQVLLNNREVKFVDRIFKAGPDAFVDGISAEKYINITKASRATATRDLQHLVQIGAFRNTGTGKGTKYHLNVKKGP